MFRYTRKLIIKDFQEAEMASSMTVIANKVIKLILTYKKLL